jgi:hypothetical protein
MVQIQGAAHPSNVIAQKSLRMEYIGSQQRAAQAQQALTEAQQAVEQQKGRMQGALEAILDRRDLDPATHRWDYDGKTVTLRTA